MADLTFTTPEGQTIDRELLIAYLNTGTKESPVWSAIGKRVEDTSEEMDWGQESKQDVLVGIADRYARDFTDMREAIEQDDSLDTLEKLERLFCAIPTKYYNIGLSRLFEVARKYPKQYRYLMEAVNQGWILAEQYLERGVREGKIREDISVPVVMAMIRGTVTCFTESDILYKNGLTYEQGKEEMVQIIMKGIRVA